MKLLINNLGKKVFVTPETFDELKQSFVEGVWGCLIRDLSNNPHMILLEENFLRGGKYHARIL